MIRLTQVLGGGLILKRQIITADGNWNRPEKMAGNTVWITAIGGGSSGRRASSGNIGWGGWGGEWVIQIPIDIGADTVVACTIGAGGAGTGSVLDIQNSGGPTSFGAYLTLLGGNNTAGAQAGGAPGGFGNASPIRPNGSDTPLGYGGLVLSFAVAVAGGGAGIVIDASSTAGGTQPAFVTEASGYGAGGGTGITPNYGFPGAPGVIMVEWMEAI